MSKMRKVKITLYILITISACVFISMIIAKSSRFDDYDFIDYLIGSMFLAFGFLWASFVNTALREFFIDYFKEVKRLFCYLRDSLIE